MSTKAVQEGGSKGAFGWALVVVAYLLWLLTSILGVVEISLVRQISIVVFTQFNTQPSPGALNLLNGIVVFIGAVVMIAYVFGGFEYLSRRVTKQVPWSMLVWAVAIELLILILYFVVV